MNGIFFTRINDNNKSDNILHFLTIDFHFFSLFWSTNDGRVLQLLRSHLRLTLVDCFFFHQNLKCVDFVKHFQHQHHRIYGWYLLSGVDPCLPRLKGTTFTLGYDPKKSSVGRDVLLIMPLTLSPPPLYSFPKFVNRKIKYSN